MTTAMTTAQQMVAAAEATLRTPYQHQGRIAGLGMDCAGVLVYALRSVRAHYQDSFGYPRLPYDGMLKKILDAQPCLEPIPRVQLEAGDVVLLRLKLAPQHLGVYVGDGYMVHAYESVGAVVKEQLGPWLGRIVQVYRVSA